MERGKLDYILKFMSKHYDYLILLVLLIWSAYVEYLDNYNLTMWMDIPCHFRAINGYFVEGMANFLYYTNAISTSQETYFNLKFLLYVMLVVITFVSYNLLYFLMKYLYKKITNKKVKIFLLILFWLSIGFVIFLIIFGCSIRIF